MSGKKNQREPKFNFGLINEIRSVICVESFNMISQKSMKVPEQRDSVFKLYHGESEIMGQAEKFIKRMSVYANMWEVEETKGGNRYIIPERLHQQYGKVLVSGDNITDSLIKRLYEKNSEELLTGAAIISTAKEAVKEAKKMHGLLKTAMKEKVLEKQENGEYTFPSGKSEDDFDQWMLTRIFNWDKYYGPSGGTLGASSSVAGDSTISKTLSTPEAMTTRDENNNLLTVPEGETLNNGNGNIGDNDDDDDDNNLPVPTNIFGGVETNPSSVADDDSVYGGDLSPPLNYVPKGWVLFKTRGPLSWPIENRIDLFSDRYSDGKRSVKNGRDHFRKEQLKEKAQKRDYNYDSASTNSRDVRGVGVEHRKFAVRAAQIDAELSLQQFEADLLRVNSVLKSKQSQRDSHMELVKLHIALGETEEAKKELALAKESMTEIASLEEKAMNLDSKGTSAIKGKMRAAGGDDDEEC